MNLQRLDLMGKPHIGPIPRRRGRGWRMPEGARCEICGAPATNLHHIVPKGMGGANNTAHVRGAAYTSPLIAVCGFGNAGGCHGAFHDGTIRASWAWDSEEERDAWLAGEFAPPDHSDEFYLHGCYRIEVSGGGVWEVRYA